MIEPGRARESAATIGFITVAGAVAGVLYVLISNRFHFGFDLAQGAMTGMFLAFPLGSFEVLLNSTVVGERLRRVRFGTLLSLRSGVYLAVTVLGLVVGDIVFDDETLSEVLTDDTFGRDIAFALSFAVTVNFVIMLRGLLGQRVLSNFILGRYHTPLVEDRIFMVVDLVGSTKAAERLGDVRFLELLDQFFIDLAGAVLETRGEIYKYVGDAAIISWSGRRRRDTPDCLGCYLQFRRRLASHAERYRERFGMVPRFRAAFHAGPVVAGEIGDLKREIVYLGDTLNAVFRIEEQCKSRGLAAVASDAAMVGVAVPSGLRVVPVDTVLLRGKSKPLPLMSIELTDELAELRMTEPGIATERPSSEQAG